MPRGDMRHERFHVNDPTGSSTEIDFDNIYFTVKKSYNDKNYLFQKSLRNNTISKISPGYYMFTIEPGDTQNLSYGRYVFDIQVNYTDQLNPQNSIKETWTGDFDLLYEVTFPENE